ncbi:MAG: GNAT family N-acetyltransferase [Verrucomicrobiota bacterium]
MAPAEVVRRGPWWLVRECDPAERPARREEWFAWDLSPAEAAAELEGLAPAGRGRPVLSLFTPGPAAGGRAAAREAPRGYRRAGREFLMEWEVAGGGGETARGGGGAGSRDRRVRRVREPGEALRIAGANRGGLISLAQLTARRPVVHLYAVWEGGCPVAWVRWLRLGYRAAYVANLWTEPAFRRRGLATALMRRVLAEARRAGVRHLGLSATRAGRAVYARLGFQDAGMLQTFTPVGEDRPASARVRVRRKAAGPGARD